MKRSMFGGANKFQFLRAKELRKQQTFAEEILWTYLQAKPFGFKFRRQHPYSIYILDFYCHALRLAIEIDGSVHDLDDVKKNDDLRLRQLECDGFTVLRFTSNELKMKPESVIERIEKLLIEQNEKGKVSAT